MIASVLLGVSESHDRKRYLMHLTCHRGWLNDHPLTGFLLSWLDEDKCTIKLFSVAVSSKKRPTFPSQWVVSVSRVLAQSDAKVINRPENGDIYASFLRLQSVWRTIISFSFESDCQLFGALPMQWANWCFCEYFRLHWSRDMQWDIGLAQVFNTSGVWVHKTLLLF